MRCPNVPPGGCRTKVTPTATVGEGKAARRRRQLNGEADITINRHTGHHVSYLLSNRRIIQSIWRSIELRVHDDCEASGASHLHRPAVGAATAKQHTTHILVPPHACRHAHISTTQKHASRTTVTPQACSIHLAHKTHPAGLLPTWHRPTAAHNAQTGLVLAARRVSGILQGRHQAPTLPTKRRNALYAA